jgi:hypothetical protein
MTDVNKVAILINKLLTLSKDGGATEAEAALATEKAQELMTEHNLSMASVEAAGGQSGDEGKRIKDGVAHRQVYKWQKSLMSSLADLNFCFSKERYVRGSVFDGYQLIGRAANVASTRLMFEYLLQTIERLARDDVKDPSQYFTRYAHSFKEGCAERVVERLKHRREQEVAEQEAKRQEQAVRAQHPGAASSNALVVVLSDYVQDETDANTDFRYNLEPGTTKQKRLNAERERAEYDAKARIRRDQRRIDLLTSRPDIDPEGDLFEWMADYGLSEESYYKAAQPKKPETEAQRAKRLAGEQREHQRWQDQRWRRDAKRDWTGYSKGKRAGDGVGLDRQVAEDRKHRLT